MALPKRCVLLLSLFLLLALGGCNSLPIAQDLTQSQATEIVATLQASGISAEVVKETGGRGRYQVEIKKNYYSQAIAILHEKSLPSEPRPSFTELVTARGIIPNSREIDALRLDRAVAAEVEELLQAHPAVLSSRVIVKQRSADQALTGEATSSGGVSAVVVLRPGIEAKESELLDIMARALPQIPRDHIFLALRKGSEDRQVTVEGVLNTGTGKAVRIPLTTFLWGWRVPEDDYNGLAIALVLGICVIFGLGAVIGCWYTFYHVGTQHPRSPSFDLASEKVSLPKTGRVVKKELIGE